MSALHELARIYFARTQPVQPVTLEENGIIIGGVFFVRGEQNYERIRALIPVDPAAVPAPLSALRSPPAAQP